MVQSLDRIRVSPAEEGVQLHDRHLRVYFGAGAIQHADFHYRWLRHACDQDRHPATRERTLDPADLSRDIRPSAARIDTQSGTLQIAWEGEQRTSVYSLSWLREHAYAPDHELAIPPASRIQPVTFDARGVDDDVVLRRALTGVERDGLVIVRGFRGAEPPELETEAIVRGFARHHLSVRSTHFGYIEDLRTDNTTNENTDQLGYTDSAIGLHTDQPFLETPPRYQLLQCIRRAPAGGANQVADALAASSFLGRLDAHAIHLLRTVLVRFHRKQREFEALFDSPILSRKRSVFQVRSSYFTLAPFKLAFDEMDAWYDAYTRFALLVRDPRYQYDFVLDEGDFLLFDNWRMLHGRSAFQGNRWLRGIYFDRKGGGAS